MAASTRKFAHAARLDLVGNNFAPEKLGIFHTHLADLRARRNGLCVLSENADPTDPSAGHYGIHPTLRLSSTCVTPGAARSSPLHQAPLRPRLHLAIQPHLAAGDRDLDVIGFDWALRCRAARSSLTSSARRVVHFNHIDHTLTPRACRLRMQRQSFGSANRPFRSFSPSPSAL